MDSVPGHELHGARQVGQWPTDELVGLWGRVCSGVVKQGFVIEYRDLEPPRTGIFDGLRIVIDPDVGFEMQCFLLLHLFGHSVQWVAPSLEHKLADLQHTEDREHFMQVLKQVDNIWTLRRNEVTNSASDIHTRLEAATGSLTPSNVLLSAEVLQHAGALFKQNSF